MSMLRSLSDLFAQSTLRRSPPEYPPHVANAKIAKSCQKQTTFFFFIYFVSATAASPAPAGQVSHHSAQSERCHTLLLRPSRIQRTTKLEALLPHTDGNTSVCLRQAPQPSPPAQTPFGIHNPSSYCNHATDGQAWTRREGGILTEHNESVLTQIKHWYKYFKGVAIVDHDSSRGRHPITWRNTKLCYLSFFSCMTWKKTHNIFFFFSKLLP